MSSQRHKFYLLTRWEDTWSQNYIEQNESCFFSEIFSNQRILNSMWKKLENQGMSVSNVHTYINMYMCILGIFLCTNLRLQHPAIFCAWKILHCNFDFNLLGLLLVAPMITIWICSFVELSWGLKLQTLSHTLEMILML